jgi:hypothetical protein
LYRGDRWKRSKGVNSANFERLIDIVRSLRCQHLNSEAPSPLYALPSNRALPAYKFEVGLQTRGIILETRKTLKAIEDSVRSSESHSLQLEGYVFELLGRVSVTGTGKYPPSNPRGKMTAHPPFLTAPLLAPTTSFNDGLIPATKRTRWCSYRLRSPHPNLNHREGRLWHSTSSSCPRIRECPPHYDPSRSILVPLRRTSDSRCLGHNGQ